MQGRLPIRQGLVDVSTELLYQVPGYNEVILLNCNEQGRGIVPDLVDVCAEIFHQASQHIDVRSVKGAVVQRVSAYQADALATPSFKLSGIAPLARLDDRGDWNLHPRSLTLFRCGGGSGGGGGGGGCAAAAATAACGGSDEVRCLEFRKHIVKVINRLSSCRFRLLLALLNIFWHSERRGMELSFSTTVISQEFSLVGLKYVANK
jgi:hypothetical protein